MTMDYTQMDAEFACLRSVGSQEHELEKPSFEIRPLGQKEKEKLKHLPDKRLLHAYKV